MVELIGLPGLLGLLPLVLARWRSLVDVRR
jgi:hypothetical protein